MFNFITKSLIATTLLRRYRKLLISVAVLFVCYFIIGEAHDDFLTYGEKTQNSGAVGLSYVIKWLLLALVTGLFYLYNTYSCVTKKTFLKQRLQQDSTPIIRANAYTDTPDPFANIRTKPKLASKAEQRLNKKNNRSI